MQDLAAEHVRIDKPGGENARLKVSALVAGMVAGEDGIEDVALLRHGAMGRLFTVSAPRRRSGRSCAASPSVTSGSSTRSRPAS